MAVLVEVVSYECLHHVFPPLCGGQKLMSRIQLQRRLALLPSSSPTLSCAVSSTTAM